MIEQKESSLEVTIPPEIVEHAHINPGDVLTWRVSMDEAKPKIIIEIKK